MEDVAPPPMQSFFATLAREQGAAGAIGEITAHLASGGLDGEAYRDIAARFGVERESWFGPQRLDLLLSYARDALDDNDCLSAAQIADLNALRTFLHIRDGEFLEHRPAEVAHILREQVATILEDAVIDREEDLYQVELQAVFGLGYDAYLALVRIVFERVWADLQLALGRGGPELSVLKRKMSALEPLVRLATSHARTMGALFS